MVLSHRQVFQRHTQPLERVRTGYGDLTQWPEAAAGVGVAEYVGQPTSLAQAVLIGVATGTGVWLATKLLEKAFFHPRGRK